MDGITWLDATPSLRRPVLIAAFEGWNDAGECASLAAGTARTALEATPLAVIDAEDFYDFQLVRPTVRMTEDAGRLIEWPQTRVSLARSGGPHDLVIVEGAEPNLRWRTYCGRLTDLAVRVGAELVVTLGALQVDVPHTRPVQLTATTSTPELGEKLGLSVGTYEGPTGITGVLHAAAAAAELPAVSVWAGVPHYLASSPYLPGALALAERLATLTGTDLPLAALARDAAHQTDEIAELVAADEELSEYVDELEERAPETARVRHADDMPAVNGEQLAEELERFLRDRDG